MHQVPKNMPKLSKKLRLNFKCKKSVQKQKSFTPHRKTMTFPKFKFSKKLKTNLKNKISEQKQKFSFSWNWVLLFLKDKRTLIYSGLVLIFLSSILFLNFIYSLNGYTNPMKNSTIIHPNQIHWSFYVTGVLTSVAGISLLIWGFWGFVQALRTKASWTWKTRNCTVHKTITVPGFFILWTGCFLLISVLTSALVFSTYGYTHFILVVIYIGISLCLFFTVTTFFSVSYAFFTVKKLARK